MIQMYGNVVNVGIRAGMDGFIEYDLRANMVDDWDLIIKHNPTLEFQFGLVWLGNLQEITVKDG